MQLTTLSKTNLEVSRIAFGCWAIVGGFNWGDQDVQDSLDAMRVSFDSGINFYDTAEAYGSGRSEQLIAKALGDVRDQIVIASKVSPRNFAPASMREACERSLRNLQTDRIDLYQLHWPNHSIPFDETFGVLEDLKSEGKILSYGVSNFGSKDLADAVSKTKSISTDQLSYSLLFRAIEFEVLPKCREQNIGVLCYSPLVQGLLTGKFGSLDEVPEDRARTRHFSPSRRAKARHGEQGAEEETMQTVEEIRRIAEEIGKPMAHVSIAWLLAQEGVTAALVGARNRQQALSNAEAGDLELPPDAIQRLDAASDRLKQKLGKNVDMWEGADSRTR